jgi:hypothetical protein
MKVDFTYGYNAPFVGPLMNVGVNYYSMQFNGSYGGATNLAYRTKNGDNNTWNPWRYIAFTDSNITGNAANGTKVGTVITFANSSVPTGFLECNGALISRTTYADLFAVIGTTYGQVYLTSYKPSVVYSPHLE